MPISEVLLPEFDQEMASTRRVLERIPDDRLEWQPHPKSMTLGRLAGHVAELPFWGVMTLQTQSLDIAPPGGPQFQPGVATSCAQVLGVFDKNVADTRAAISATSDEQWAVPWSLLAGGHVLMTMPRSAVVRSMVMNHSIHHRAQLGVYLRLNDIAVPGAYGPSADER